MTLRLVPAAFLAATLAATLVVYAGVLGCFFWADDIVYLYDARNGSALEFLLIPYGGHLSWARNLLFLVLERLAGPNPAPFFALVLATHLLNVALCFAVVRLWTGSALLAGVWATLWGTSPRNAATLEWFAGHSQMVVATVMLLLLWRAGALLARGTVPTARDAWAAVALCVLATASFGIGLGLGMVVPLAALLLFPRMSRAPRLLLLALFVILPLCYVAGQLAYAAVGTRALSPSGGSLLATLPTAVELTVRMTGTGLAGLLAGFTTTAPIAPSAALAAAAGLGLALVVALVPSDGPTRRRLLAVALLPLAIYGITAVGRAPNLKFAGGTARIVATPRYHYAAPLGLAILAALLCAEAGRRLRVPAAVGKTSAALVVVIGALAWAQSPWHLDDHAWIAERVDVLLAEVDTAAAAAAPATPVVLPNRPFGGVGPMFMLTPTVFPRFAGVYVAFRASDEVAGRPIRFAESDPAVYAALTANPQKRIARLLVPAP